jgi:pimeloyl-ACP methyl ester carboxylesterase
MQIDIDGLLVNYKEFHPDQKETLVILHGWASSLRYWIPVSRLLSDSVRVILLDLPGFGDTPPVDNTPDIPEYTEFVRKFCQKLSLRKFMLAGHSFGGQIALDYALKYPEDLKSIILMAPAAILKKTDNLDLKVKIADKIKPFLSNPSKALLEQAVGWHTPDEYSNSNKYQKEVLRKIIAYNLEPLLPQVGVPTHIIWGNLDIVVPNYGDYMAKQIPGSHLYIIPGANHLLNLTHTQKLAVILNQIISSHPKP